MRVLVDGAWGFACDRRLTTEGGARRGAPQGGRVRRGRRRAAHRRDARAGRAGARASSARRSSATRSRSRSPTRSTLCLRAEEALAHEDVKVTLGVRPRAARAQGLRLLGGRRDRAGARRVRRRDRRDRRARRRHADPQLPERARRLERAGRLGVRRVARPRARGSARRPSRRPRSCAPTPCPSRGDDGRDRRRADAAPGARVGRPPDRARPRLRHRGRLRRHELPQAGRPRLAPLRLGAHEHHRRLDHARRARHASASTTRACRPAASRSSREGVLSGFLTSRETAARIGSGSGGSMRADSWSRMPLVRMTNLHLEPGEGSLDELIAGVDDGVFLRDEQELVDRRQAPQLPVRDADRLGDQGRQARADAARRDLHRADAGLLGLARRASPAPTSGACTG